MQDQRPVNFEEHVYPPYHGEETHPDPARLIAPISAFRRQPKNARLHDGRNLGQIRASLRRKERGQQTPINVDRQGNILKGNGTHEAAELEGWQYIWFVVSSLEGPEAKAYENADNLTGLSSAWDYKQLAEDTRSLKEFDGTELEFSADDLALDDGEISALLNPGPRGRGGEDDAAPKKRERPTQDPHPDLDEGDRADRCSPIVVTPNMRVVIDQAVERVRLISGDLTVTEGKCLELICYDYLAGAPSRDQALDIYEGRLTESLEPVGAEGEQRDVQLREDEHGED